MLKSQNDDGECVIGFKEMGFTWHFIRSIIVDLSEGNVEVSRCGEVESSCGDGRREKRPK